MRSWRQLSIVTKLPLGIAALLAVVLTGLGLTAWSEVRGLGERAAIGRLETVTGQLASQFSAAIISRLADIDSLATDFAIADAITTGSPAELERVRTALANQADPNNEILVIEVWDANAVPRLRTDTNFVGIEREEAIRLARVAADANGIVGRFRVQDGQVSYPLVVPVTTNDSIVGFVAERRRGATREAIAALSETFGSGARVVVGSKLGGDWTDLVTGTAAPPAGLDVTLPIHRYERAGEAVYAHGDTVPRTEWLMIVEFPANVVNGPASEFLRRTAFLSLLFIGLGGLVGWFASRRMTTPLRRLARGVAVVAAGQPLTDDLASGRDDEIGRLGEAFTLMAAEVARSREILEERVRERTFALQAANAELESFSYSVSHDLRAPLRAIDGFSRILVEDHAGELTAEAQHCVEVIARNSRQMGQLIDDLLSLSRIGRHELSDAPIDMTGLAETVADEIRRLERGRNMEIRVEPLPAARGERTLVRQVFVNLIGNAAKFTRPCDYARIEVGSSQENGSIVYHVRDNGVGFDMKYAEKLFGVFQRLHRPDEFDGTGVGLAIVHRIVTRHDGRVWAESKPGRGSTFYFTLS